MEVEVDLYIVMNGKPNAIQACTSAGASLMQKCVCVPIYTNVGVYKLHEELPCVSAFHLFATSRRVASRYDDDETRNGAVSETPFNIFVIPPCNPASARPAVGIKYVYQIRARR